jgi:hypothetical protein
MDSTYHRSKDRTKEYLERILRTLLWILLFGYVWRRTKVDDHLSISLGSDVQNVDLAGIVTFHGKIVDLIGTGQPNVSVEIKAVDPAGAESSYTVVTDVGGEYALGWIAVLPAGAWSFKAVAQTIESNELLVTRAHKYPEIINNLPYYSTY